MERKSCDTLFRLEVTFTSSVVEEVDSAACALLEASSFMGCLLYVARFMIFSNCSNEAKCYSFLLLGPRHRW